jgi:PKD domain
MMRIRLPLWALLLAALAFRPAIAQNEYNVWCMGVQTGIDFNGTAPVPSYSAFITWEACATICDPATGRLLFYSDAQKVYNRDHQMMPNGNGLLATETSTQGALIVPMPANPNRYYLFTSDAGDYDNPPNQGIHYSVIDMSLDGGRGDVVTKNVPLLGVATEKLTAIRHNNGCAFWVLCHGWNDSIFYAYLVDDQGVSAPVQSPIGIVHRDPPNAAPGLGTIGYMKSSPDGQRLAVATFEVRLVELFTFDDRTGVLSNPIALPLDDNPYGVSFSPDNTKLYVSCGGNRLYQFDLADPDPAAIVASQTLISNQVSPTNPGRYAALQLAPNGKIYHAHAGTPWLGAIHNPNARGAACGYVFHDLNLPTNVMLGLPNLIESYFVSGNLACGAPAADFTPGDTLICAGSCIDFTDLSINDPTSWSWSFPGAVITSSTDRHPAGICYAEPGTYRVTLRASNARGTGTRSRNVIVAGRGDLRAHIDRDYKAAPGDTITVPLILDAPLDAARIGQLSLTLDYGRGTLSLDTIDHSRGVLAGWKVDSIHDERTAGRCTIYLSAPAGSFLQGTGTLADLRFFVYLGGSDTASVRFVISSPTNRCLGTNTEPGRVTLEFCDLRNRLIEFGPSSYSLDANRPNPFNPSTVIPFSTGLDGHVTLTIHNVLGATVATLVDGEMPAGSHTVTWDAAKFPSGLYYYRLVTGPWSAMRGMMLTK